MSTRPANVDTPDTVKPSLVTRSVKVDVPLVLIPPPTKSLAVTIPVKLPPIAVKSVVSN